MSERPWDSDPELDPPDDALEAWRGEEHPEDWPEILAGPEYWLYRKMHEEEGDDDGTTPPGRGPAS